MRSRTGGGLTFPGRRRLLAFCALLGAGITASACESVPPELRPARELVDALGLSERDVVYEVGVRTVDGAETVTPSSVVMDRPGRLSFRSDDPRARRIRMDTAALAPELREWVRTRAVWSPPLVQVDARWVVDLREAPVGDVAFVAEGGGADGLLRVVIPVRD